METIEKRLYDASVEGNVARLLELIQEDEDILDKIAPNSDNMPLHVASMYGHIAFVEELLRQKRELSLGCDSQRRLPIHIAAVAGHVEVVNALMHNDDDQVNRDKMCLWCDRDGRMAIHLAAAAGHVEVVKAMVEVNPDEMCNAKDRDERMAIHFAAIRGRCEVVKELMRVHPNAAKAKVQDDTILHLCVKYNQLEVLMFLIESMKNDYNLDQFVNAEDAYGNTILHLAVADKQNETVKFLVDRTNIEVDAIYDKWKMIDQYLENKKNTLAVVAVFVAAMAFQAIVDLDIWKESKDGSYYIFMVTNTVGFFLGLTIVLLLVGGPPILRRRVFSAIMMCILWIATIAMLIAYTVSIWSVRKDSITKGVVVCITVLAAPLITFVLTGHIENTDRIFENIKRRFFPDI